MSLYDQRTSIPRPSARKICAINIWQDLKVVKSFCAVIKCEETLHILRFLNRIWNEAASSQLRRLSCVDLTRKSFVEIQDFWNILQYNKLLKLPCPFRRYKLAIQVVQDELIADIIEQKDVQLVCLCYTTDQNITQDSHLFKNLYEILMQHQTSLQHFKLTYSNVQKSSEDEGWYNHELKLPDLKLTALREFDFFSWSFGLLQEDEPFRRFLCSIFKAAPNLRRFCTNFDDSNLINGLLSKGLLRKITSLYLKKLTPSSFSSISNAQISLRKITSLGLTFLGVSQHIDLSTLIVILRQVKRKLEELAVTKVSLVNGHGFPAMTNLRRLLLHDSCGSLGELNETRFPNLQCLYLSDFNQNSDKNHNEDGGSDDFVSNPHFGVQELAMKFSFHDRGEGRSCKSLKEKQLTLLLAMLPLQFPNLSSFYLYMPKVSLEIIRSVIRLFPSLEALKLESLGPEFYLPEDLFTQHDNQCECPDFDQACNFLSLKRLKSLTFSAPNVEESSCLRYLTNRALREGLMRLRELAVFHFDWHEELSAGILCKCFRRLKEVKITVRGETPDELQRLPAPPEGVAVTVEKYDPGDTHDKNVHIFNFHNYFQTATAKGRENSVL